MKTSILLSAMAAVAYARCPNHCNNQGTCGANSQCHCYRNFQGSDCSERVCFYSHAFVDTPFGDANADGDISMTVTFEEQTQNYMLEGYPLSYGKARQINGISESERWDEAHFYRECSNKGLCNRKTGQCDCFPGYEGEGCQRTTCPGTGAGITCSGHGLCLSAYASQPEYSLWDKDKTMTCECDAGYTGPDCSLRQCPSGADPVKHSDKVTTSLQKITWGTIGYEGTFFEQDDSFDKVMNGPVYFTVTVSDEYGDEWTTNTLSIEYATTCDTAQADGATDYDACMSMPIFNPIDDRAAAQLNDLGAGTLNADFAADPQAADGGDSFLPKSNAGIDWYSTSTIADELNNSLQALPNGAVKDPKTWMWYVRSNPLVSKTTAFICGKTTGCPGALTDATTLLSMRENDIKYPEDQADGYEGLTIYWNSPASRYPDFASEGHLDKKWWDCGRIDGREDQNNDGLYTGTDSDTTQTTTTAVSGRVSVDGTGAVKSTEGLCLYISSGNSITTASENYKVTYSYNSKIMVDLTDDDSSWYYGQLQVGSSFSVETILEQDNGEVEMVFSTVDGNGIPMDGSGLIDADVPLVTVEEVGKYRYWDVNIDGYPEQTYNTRSVREGETTVDITSTFETHECSKRGLCDQATGECQCFSGYTGTSCNSQNAISYS